MITAMDGMPGYVVDCGYLRKLEPWETLQDVTVPEPPRASSRIAPPMPLPELRVYGVAIGGKWPSESQVERIRSELRRAPACVLQQWRDRGCRCEVTPGKLSANRHPRAGLMRATDGWASRSTGLIVIAEQAGEGTALHELGHCFDSTNRLGMTFEWRKIFEENLWNAAFHSYYRENAEELFAEAFSMYYVSAATRAKLPKTIRAFIERSVT